MMAHCVRANVRMHEYACTSVDGSIVGAWLLVGCIIILWRVVFVAVLTLNECNADIIEVSALQDEKAQLLTTYLWQHFVSNASSLFF